MLCEEVAPDHSECGRVVPQGSCDVDHEGVVDVDKEGQLLFTESGSRRPPTAVRSVFLTYLCKGKICKEKRSYLRCMRGTSDA